MSHPPDQSSPTRRNFWLNVADGALFSTAMAMVPVSILLPAYVRKFTDNEYLVNLVTALFLFGVTAPQIFVARFLDSLPRKKPLMMFTGVIQRLPWLVLALAAWFIPPERATLHLILLFTMLGVFAFSCGANIPVWLVLLGKLIPESQRGRLMAWRQMIAMGLAVGGAAGSRYILKAWAFPHNYALLFLCFFLLTSLSYVTQLFIREEHDDPVQPSPGLREHLGRLFHLLNHDRNYTRYVVASVLLTMGGLYGGLITSYGIDRYGLANRDYVFAYITMLSAPVGMATLYLFGHLGDRHGHKLNHVWSAFFVLLAMAALRFGHSLPLYVAAYVLIQIAVNTEIVSRTAILLEFGGPERAASYVSVKNTITAPFSLAAPLLGAFLARRFGYDAVFLVTFVMFSLAVFYISFHVNEPRKARHGKQ